MRVYEIATGRMYDEHPDGLRLIARCSSGFMAAADDVNREGEMDIGPIPPGAYAISDPYEDPHLGPVVMKLTPLGDTDVLGRDGSSFRIHGVRIGSTPEASSHGCIVTNRPEREVIAAGSRLMTAVSSLNFKL